MWNISSTTEALTDLFSDVGTVLALAIPAVIAVAVALIGLGYGYRLVKKYVTGKKF